MDQAQEKYVIDMSFDAAEVDKGISRVEKNLEKLTGKGKLERAIRLRAYTDQLKRDLSAARKTLNTALKSGDQEVIIKAKLEEATLQGALIKIRKELRETDKAATLDIYGQKSKQLSKLQREYKNLALSKGETSKEARKLLGEITVLDKQLKKLDTTVGQNQRNVGNYGKAFSTAKGYMLDFLGTIGLVGGATAALSSTFSAAIDFEQVETQFEVLFGSVEKGQKMLQELTEFAKVTPFTIPGVRDAAAKLKAYGFEAEEIIPTLRKVGDISRGNQDIFDRLTYALGQVRAAGKLYGTELRQFTETGIPLIEELGKVHGVAASEIRNMVEDGKISYDDVVQAMTNMTSEGGQFAGLMEKQSKTVAGAWSNLKDSVTQAQEQIAKSGFYETIRQGLLSLAENLPSILQGFTQFLGLVKDIVGTALIPFKIALEAVLLLFKGLVFVLSPITPVIKFISSTLGSFLKVVASGAIALYAFNTAIKVVSGSMAIFRAILGAQMITAFAGFVSGSSASTVATLVFGKAIAGTTFLAKALRIALLMSGVGIALVGIGAVVSKLASNIEKAKKTVENLKQSFAELGIASKFKKESEEYIAALDKMKDAYHWWGNSHKQLKEGYEESIEAIDKLNSKVGQSAGALEKDIEAYMEAQKKLKPFSFSKEAFYPKAVEYAQKKYKENSEEFEEITDQYTKNYETLTNAQNKLSFDESIQKIQEFNTGTNEQFNQWLGLMEEKAIDAGDVANEISFAVAQGLSREEALARIIESGAIVDRTLYNALLPLLGDTLTSAYTLLDDGTVVLSGYAHPMFAKGANIVSSISDGINSRLPGLQGVLNSTLGLVDRFLQKISGATSGELGAKIFNALGIKKQLGTVGLVAKGTQLSIEEKMKAVTIPPKTLDSMNSTISLLEKERSAVDVNSDAFKTLSKRIGSAKSELDKYNSSSSSKKSGSSGGSSSALKAEKEEKKEREELIKDLQKLSEDAEKDLTKVKEKHSKKRQKAEEEYQDTVKDTQDEIEKIEEKHSEMVKKVLKEKRDLIEQEKELKNTLNETLAESNKEYSDDVASRVQELKQELSDLQNEKNTFNFREGNGDDYAEIIQQIRDVQALISEGEGLVTQEDLQRAKEYAELSEFGKLQFDQKQKIKELEEEFEAEKALLEEKKTIQEAYLAGEVSAIESASEYKTQLYLEELKQEELLYQATALEKEKFLIEYQKKHEDHLAYLASKEETAVNNSIRRWQRAEQARAEAMGEDFSIEDLKYQVTNSSQEELAERLSGVEDIQDTEKMLHEEKIDYYRKEYEEHRQLVEGQKAHLSEMIAMIKEATIAQERLNALREASSEASVSSDNRSYTINQNIQSQAQADLYARAVRNAQ